MSTLEHWHLMKHDDGTVFGPVTFEQIKEWAQAAQVSPLDKISDDELNWIKAPMYADLEMDWLLQMSDDHYYGPTTLRAIQEFIKEGEIDNETSVVNCKNATQTKVGELPFLIEEPVEEDLPTIVDAEHATLLQRIEVLEAELAIQKERLEELESTVLDFIAPR